MDRARNTGLEAMIEREFARPPGASRRPPIAASSDADADREPRCAPGRVILVDGFNVLHAVLLGREREQGWWRREPRERLLRRIAGWPDRRDEIWVAFDGNQPAWSVWAEPEPIEKPASVTAMWSRSSTGGAERLGPIVHHLFVVSADDWIVRRARRTPWPDRMVVVSGDHKVTGRARSAGCSVWTPWALVSRCPSPRPTPGIGGATGTPAGA